MKVYLDTIGCRLNQSEIETFARQFRTAGHSLVPKADQADLVVINTCTVTAAAAADSRGKVRQAHRAGAKEIVLTGCWATLEPEQAAGLVALRQLHCADSPIPTSPSLGCSLRPSQWVRATAVTMLLARGTLFRSQAR